MEDDIYTSIHAAYNPAAARSCTPVNQKTEREIIQERQKRFADDLWGEEEPPAPRFTAHEMRLAEAELDEGVRIGEERRRNEALRTLTDGLGRGFTIAAALALLKKS